MKRLRTSLFLILAALLLAVTGCGEKEPLALNGEDHVTINVGEEYVDAGVNYEEAEVTENVDTSQEGTYLVTWTYGEETVKRRVTVIDPDKLVIGLKGDAHTIVKQNEEYIESGAYGIDHKLGPIAEYTTEGEVDTSTPGEYKVTYNFKDGTLEKSIERTVEVVAEEDFVSDMTGVPVVMYHYVYTLEDWPARLDANWILDTDLKEQLTYLRDNNYYFPSFTELRAYIDGTHSLPENSVILTFDDGHKSFLKNGIPVIEEIGVPVTSFVITSLHGESKVKKYASEYVQFQSHSNEMHHGGGNLGHGGIISALWQEQIVEDLNTAAGIVGNNNAFAYPYGDYTETAFYAVDQAGIECSFTTNYGKVYPYSNPRCLNRIRSAGTNTLEGFLSTLQ